MAVAMRRRTRPRNRRESGTALLIALFALLLVGVVAIALLVSAGTETSLTSNYRTANAVYYAAIAGLEEARGRLYSRNPNYLNTSVPGSFPSPLPVQNVIYIRNPYGGETVNPSDLSAGNAYADREYATEFSGTPAVTFIDSVSGASGTPGPMYKWVRITPATEQSLGFDVDSNGFINPTQLMYYDPAHVDGNGNASASVISVSSPPATAQQVYQITALAALPNGSQKMVQYVAAPVPLGLAFPAALTIDGPGGTVAHPSLTIDGDDADVGACHGDQDVPGTVIGPNGTFPPVLQTVGQLNSLATTIRNNSDRIIQPVAPASATQWDLPLASMSATNPMTVVVNGDLDLSGWNGAGYGLLLVTGTLKYDQDASWHGMILVIGQGNFISTASAGSGHIYGAVLVARLFDAGGNPLSASSAPGPSNFNMDPASGGIFFRSCWVRAAQPQTPYTILSFRELSQ